MMETNIMLLITLPILFSLLFLVLSKSLYKLLSWAFFILAAFFSVSLVLGGAGKVDVIGSNFELIENIVLVLEVLIMLYIFYVSAKYKRWPTFSLAIIQAVIAVYSYLNLAEITSASFNIDQFTHVLLLIVNIIGTLIIVFATGYMDQYEEHRHMKSRQKAFYFTMCLFIGAMNGLVMSDTLSWLYLFWEVTTLSSFVLISYNQDEEAIDSGFRALFLNLVGGLSFSLAIIYFSNNFNISNLSQLINNPQAVAMVLPVFLLCLAGFAKSAQMPFHSWLLGAMIAPTPVSALLHSSTMVNAGVYVIVRLAPAYANTTLGAAIAIYGAFTFVICSALAISQRNAKRVLAYSTIANLGLIIASAGLGSSLAVSAAIMLILFHAISKGLLFLCTGEIEHTIGSRDIEDMSGLIKKAPFLTIITSVGMVSMLLPPFGVLITKWISLEAAASNPIVSLFLVLGSALTTVYYVKWLGTILSSTMDTKVTSKLKLETYFPLSVLCLSIVATSIFIFSIYDYFVKPEVTTLLNVVPTISGQGGQLVSDLGGFAYSVVFVVLVLAIVIYFIARKLLVPTKVDNIYMCGENNLAKDKLMFRNGLCAYEKSSVSNIYLENVFGENKLTTIGYAISILIIIYALAGGLL